MDDYKENELYCSLNSQYKSQIDNIIGYIIENKIEDEILVQFSNFTDHGLNHLHCVAKNVSTLVKPIKLSQKEKFCILASCYCHDLGMAHTNAQLAYKFCLRNDIRRWHAHLSSLYIQNELPERCILEEEMRDSISIISAGHGRWDWDNYYFNNRYGIRFNLLIPILCLGDALDLRHQRKNPNNFPTTDELIKYPFLKLDITNNQLLTEKPELVQLCKVHWLKHYYSKMPSIEYISDRTIKIELQAAIGLSNKNIDCIEYDPRRSLIEEIIQSEIIQLLNYSLFVKYMKPHIEFFLPKQRSSSWDSIVHTTFDPTKMLFPNELVKTAITGGLIKEKHIKLTSRNQYYLYRIEPFIQPDDFTISVSWLPSALAPNKIAKGFDENRKKACKKIKDTAKIIWDYCLFPIEPYVDFLVNCIKQGEEEDVIERLNTFFDMLKRIKNKEYKRYYIAIFDSVPSPVTTSQVIAKVGRYSGFPKKDNFLGGDIYILNSEQKFLFNTQAKILANKLGIKCNDEEINKKLKITANHKIAYEISLKTFLNICYLLQDEISNIKNNLNLKKYIQEIISKNALVYTAIDNKLANLQKNTFDFEKMTFIDIENVLKIEKNNSDFPWFKDKRFIEFIKTNEAFILKLCKEIIGYVLISKKNKYILIEKMVIDKFYRRRGCAKLILKEIIKLLKNDNKYHEIRLHVRESNNKAIKLYKNFGFITRNYIKGYYKKTGNTDKDKNAYEMSYNI